MITINGIEYVRMPCGRLIPASEQPAEDACCGACIVMLSEFPGL